MIFKRRVKILVAVAALVATAAVLISAGKGDFRLGRSMEIMANMMREVNLLYVDPVAADKLLTDAARGLVSNLDPYTEYMSEEDVADFEVITTGKYAGVGSLIRKKGDWVAFSEPYKGFPADKAGLVAGDKIVEIAGKDAKGMTTQKVSSLLRGDPGTSVKIKVEKLYSGDTVALTLRRERIVISGIPYYGMVSERVGYIRHDDFSEDCANDLRKAFVALRKDGRMKGLIIDLRGNGGGILQQAVKILSLFTPKGTEVVSMRGKVKQLDQTFYTEGEPLDAQIPIVVLVNGGSASASEIVAGSLQDLDRAVLMGQRTFGKGLVQSTRPLGYNSFLKITTAKYYIPSGRCIQAIDYTNRREDGSAGYIPDSLRKEFATAGGRVVYDGGGIMPDVATTAEYTSRFVMTLYAMGYIDDFVDGFMRANPDLEVSLDGFKLPATCYAAFGAFMKDKHLDFESESHAALRQLRESAERDKYSEKLAPALAALQAAMPDELEENLSLYRDDLSELIEDNIVLRRHYSHGVIAHSLHRDREVKAAVELLGDQPRYKALLTAKR